MPKFILSAAAALAVTIGSALIAENTPSVTAAAPQVIVQQPVGSYYYTPVFPQYRTYYYPYTTYSPYVGSWYRTWHGNMGWHWEHRRWR